METSLLLPLILWALFALFVLFRKDTAIGLRILPMLFLLLAGLYWQKEIAYGFNQLSQGKIFVLYEKFTTLINYMFVAQFIVWPFATLLAFLVSQSRDAKLLILFFSGYSLIVTVLYFWLNLNEIFSTTLK